MASREEEKRRRREERLAREQAEAKAAARRKRLQYVFGGLLAIAAVAGIVVVAVIGIGGGSDSEAEPGSPSQADVAGVNLPEQQIGDVKAAAKAAGCDLKSPEIEGSTHETKKFTAADYKTNPPTSGNHTPDWYEDGIYEPGDAPEIGKTVHTLEHGRVDVQYKRGTSADTIKQLEALLAEQDGYHMLLFQNETDMPYAVAASAWGQLLGCKTMSPEVFDALRTFRAEYVDKGPEAVP